MVASSLGHKYHLLYIYAAGQQFYTYADFSPLPRTRTRMWLGLVIRNEVHFNDAHKSAPRGEILWCSFPLSKIHNKLSYTDVVRVCVCVCLSMRCLESAHVNGPRMRGRRILQVALSKCVCVCFVQNKYISENATAFAYALLRVHCTKFSDVG